MDLSALLDALGEDRVAALFGLVTGIVFGVAAQRSSFCLRAATVEFARILGQRGLGFLQGGKVGLFEVGQRPLRAGAGLLDAGAAGGDVGEVPADQRTDAEAEVGVLAQIRGIQRGRAQRAPQADRRIEAGGGTFTRAAAADRRASA